MGCDNIGLLLREVITVDGHKIGSTSWAPDVRVYKSPMSPQFSILGMINKPPWIQQISPKANGANGVFHFTYGSQHTYG